MFTVKRLHTRLYQNSEPLKAKCSLEDLTHQAYLKELQPDQILTYSIYSCIEDHFDSMHERGGKRDRKSASQKSEMANHVFRIST